VIRFLLELALAPALVAASTFVCRRWGTRLGGLLSALPAVVGPLLLITAQQRGAAFAARTATGTLLGLIALAAFTLVYARAAVHGRWAVSLFAGWGCAAAVGGLVELLGPHVGLATTLLASTLALACAYFALPSLARESTPADASGREIVVRMAATTGLVIGLAVAAQLLGPRTGGLLAGLPVLASVLAVFTHRRGGTLALIALLRGMLAGMPGFVAFCAVVALLIEPAGPIPAFVAATLVATTLQGLAVIHHGLRWSRA
jgi:hypothetical protein